MSGTESIRPIDRKFIEKPVLVEQKLTLEQERSFSYKEYPTKHKLIDAEEGIETGAIEHRGHNIAYRPETIDVFRLGKREVIIKPKSQYDMLAATIFGLNDALIRGGEGSSLRETFEKEWTMFNQMLQEEGNYHRYGTYAYYPASGNLVQFAPEFLHRLSLVTSNSTLLEDPDGKLSWAETRVIFERQVVGIAGTSVGSNIVRNVLMDLNPKNIKFGDPAHFKVSNGNRVWLGYDDITYSEEMKAKQANMFGLKNKALGLAEQIHKRDPFMNVWPYYDGISDRNIHSFIAGVEGYEPRLTLAIDEMDRLDDKMLFREECRREKVRLIMATDAGSSVWIEIRPFDTNPDATLSYGISDEELYERLNEFNQNPAERQNFFRVAEGLIGKDYKKGEFGKIIDGKSQMMFKSIPQLGSTAAVAGGIVAEITARASLGWKFPERFFIDKNTLEIGYWGERV